MFTTKTELRDYFAAQAMGMISPFPERLNEYNKEEFKEYVEMACACCYQIADQMMKERDV